MYRFCCSERSAVVLKHSEVGIISFAADFAGPMPCSWGTLDSESLRMDYWECGVPLRNEPCWSSTAHHVLIRSSWSCCGEANSEDRLLAVADRPTLHLRGL